MKKIISIIMVISIMVSMLSTMAFADGTMAITGAQDVVPVYYDESNYLATVEFTVTNAVAITQASLQLTVPDELTVVSINAGTSVTELKNTFDADLYTYTTGVASGQNTVVINMNGVDQTMANGVILKAFILVPNTIENDTYEIGIGKTNGLPGNISNVAEDDISCTFTAGSIVVTNGVSVEADTYTVNFNNIADYTAVSVEVGSAPSDSDMPTATKDADNDYTYSFSHWSTDDSDDGTAIDWTTVAANESVTVYPVFTAVGAGQVAVNYTIKTELDKTEYRSGDTATATISVTAGADTNIGSYDIQDIVYDSTYLTLTGVTAASGLSPYTSINQKTYAVGYVNSTGLTVGTTATTLFTATFTVNSDVATNETTVTVDDVVMTPVGYDSNAGTISTAGATAEIIKTIVITLEAETDAKGTIGTTTEFTMDSGDSLADVKAMSGYADPTANTNYVWTGWYDGDTLLEDEDTFDENTTITAKFAAGSFTFAGDSANNTGVTITEGDGIDTTGETDKVTYLTDATFEVEAPTGYILNSVSYQVGTGSATELTASTSDATSGTYTIEGENITGDITIVVSVVEYHTVTFQSGTGSSMEAVTYYAKDGSANTGLYESLDTMVAGTTTDVEPTYTISDGYRESTSPWITGDTATTFAAIQQANITEDTTYTVNVVQTYEVKFVAGDSNGTVAETTTDTYDTGATVTVPEVTPVAGYVFSNWTSSTDTTLGATAETTTATENVTYTATFTEGTYTVTFPTVTGVSFDTVTGATATVDEKVYNATYSTNEDAYVTFKISTTDVVIDSVSYTVSGGTAVTIVADADGVYKIPSSAITSGVSITVTADSLYTVKFESENTTYGTVTGTTSFNVVDEGTLGSDNFEKVTVTPATGYQFDGWYIGDTLYANPENKEVTANVTYTAKFSQMQYEFTATEGTVTYVSGYGDSYATYGEDVTFTISSDDYIITGVKLGDVTLEATDGVYTIKGTSISGSDSELELTVSYFTGEMTFIDLDSEYFANVTEAEDRKIMVLSVDGDTEGGTTYKLSTQVALYWSEKYEAYVTIVDDAETAATLSVGMTSDSTTIATAISYGGDLNGDGAVRSDDAGVVNDILHGKRVVTTTDMQMLMADLDGSKILSTTDVTAIMNTVLGIDAD